MAKMKQRQAWFNDALQAAGGNGVIVLVQSSILWLTREEWKLI